MFRALFRYALPLFLAAGCCTSAPGPLGAVPDAAQVEWQKMEVNMFCHFGPNTFSGLEWGSGAESEDIFNPTSLDCRQWARTAAAAGMNGIIITAKHHDGFCLWPNPESTHTVASCSWRDGKGDVLRELSDACREYGLKFGVYISPWDRNDPSYGSGEYNQKYASTLRSVLDGRYGEVFEQWFDGACGEGPSGRRQVYDWSLFHRTVRELQPSAVMFSDVGPGCRWVGNERGEAGLTNWSTLDTCGFSPGAGAPPCDTLQTGNKGAPAWIPAETDVSIRPGWFWRSSESPKSVEELLRIYYESVGRGSVLLLNVPPDTSGRISREDSLVLMQWRRRLDADFAVNLSKGARFEAPHMKGFPPSRLGDGNYESYWAAPEGVLTPCICMDFRSPRCFDRIVLQEYIPLGQRVEAFTVEALTAQGWEKISSGTTIGYKRILQTAPVVARKVRITIDAALGSPVLSEVGIYQAHLSSATGGLTSLRY